MLKKKFKRCLCLKYYGKWKEIVYFKKETNEYTIALSYYSNGKTLCTATLIDNKPKIKIKTIKIRLEEISNDN